jgi:VanZ family protein
MRFTFWAYIVAILLLITLPLNSVNSYLSNTYVVEVRLDYLGHILLFAPFLFLVKHTYLPNIIAALLTGLTFAVATEFLQYFLPYRVFNINDLLSNALGIPFGMVFIIPAVSKQLLRLMPAFLR